MWHFTFVKAVYNKSDFLLHQKPCSVHKLKLWHVSAFCMPLSDLQVRVCIYTWAKRPVWVTWLAFNLYVVTVTLIVVGMRHYYILLII